MTDRDNAIHGAYRERAQLVALLAAIYPSHIGHTDPAEPDWAVVTIEAPAGQLSWHISPDDRDLFAHVEPTNSNHPAWDGHTTEQKYQRIRDLVESIDAGKQQRGVMQPNSDGETFEVGKFYITANRAFVFQCQEIVDGIALGRELRVDDRPSFAAHYVYHRERLEGCYREISADEVYERFGRGGWNPTPQHTDSGRSTP